jgi:hypothetical protein
MRVPIEGEPTEGTVMENEKMVKGEQNSGKKR